MRGLKPNGVPRFNPLTPDPSPPSTGERGDRSKIPHHDGRTMSQLWTFCPACKALLAPSEEQRLAPSSCKVCGSALTCLAETAGEANWFFAHNRTKIGPVSRMHLQLLLTAGVLQPGDMVLRQGESRWIQASAIPGFVPDIPIAQPLMETATRDVPFAQVLALPGETGADHSFRPSVVVRSSAENKSDPSVSTPAAPAEHFADPNDLALQATDLPGQELVSSALDAGPRPRTDPAYPTIAGYEILSVLGRGGMGVVYKARHLSLKRFVALKMILAGNQAGDEVLARFRAEAETVAHLQHPHIVQIHDVGEQDGCPYFSLEFVEGSTLAQRLLKGSLSAEEAAALVETLARAMHHAHQRGIVHRDLKPSNVLLTPEGTPKISDFGLAKQLEGDMGQTRSGAVMGTPSYMAPEQAAGKIHDISPRTDVYALGAILYELLAGKPPFRGRTLVETLEQVRLRDPVPPSRLRPKVPRDLETICLKALAKEPALRYPTALALAHDLARFQAGEPILGRRQGLVRKAWRNLRRSPALAASLLMFLLAAGVVGFFVLRANSDAQRVAAAVRAFDAGLQTLDSLPEQLEAVERQIDDLNRLSPEQAAAARERLNQRFAEAIRAAFANKPVLEPEDIDSVEQALNLLAARAPDREQPLRQEFQDRRSSMQLTLDLKYAERTKAPFQTAADARSASLVHTQVRCQGNVQMEVVFSSWEIASRVGLVLNAGDGTGYTFLLQVGPSPTDFQEPRSSEIKVPVDKDTPSVLSLAQARKSGRYFAMRVFRNGILLQQRLLRPAEVSTSLLRLSVKHTGERLLFQINAAPPLEFQDLFPLTGADPGVFALEWPEGVRLESLQAWRQSLPAAPSPLERGDDFFSRGRLSEAKAEYTAQANLARHGPVNEEARFKAALCQTRLGEDAEAEPVFQELASGAGLDRKGKRWAVLADCQLWLLYLRQDRIDKADTMIEKLSTRDDLSFEKLAVHVPWEDLQGISTQYYARGITLVTRKPEDLLRNAERLVKVQSLLDPSSRKRQGIDGLYWSRLGLLKASLLAGKDQRALQVADELIQDYGPEIRTCELLCWLLRSRSDCSDRSEHKRALVFVDKWLASAPAGTHYLLLIERARINVGLEQWEDAEKDLNEYFRIRQEKKHDDYNWFSSACAIQGFVRLHTQDEAAARAAWRKGLFKNVVAKPNDQLVQSLDVEPSAAINSMILSALVDDASDEDNARNAAWLASLTSRDPSVAKYVQLAPLPPKLFVEMWRTPRGRELAQRYVLRHLTYAEAVRVPALVIVYEMLHQDLAVDPLTKEQDEVLWKLVEDLYFAYLHGKLRKEDLFSIYMTWSGIPNISDRSWQSVTKMLQPPLRGPLAYVMGLHYRISLKKPSKETADFFRTSLTDAPPDSPLRRLAQEELDRPGTKR